LHHDPCWRKVTGDFATYDAGNAIDCVLNALTSRQLLDPTTQVFILGTDDLVPTQGMNYRSFLATAYDVDRSKSLDL
jgi:hypothetical protein